MNTPNANKRDYIISDDSMLQDSRTTQAEFVKDATTFKTFDADFVDAYKTNWLTAINAAANAPTDETVIDVQTNLTSVMEEKLDVCRQHFQFAKYYIEKTFPDKPGIWNEFGFDNYDGDRQSAEKMIVFMNTFSTVANKAEYKPLLIAAGYTQANIDAILTKRQALIDAKNTQELSKNSRTGSTESRITLLNAVWAIRSKVAKAAKNIFIDNYARYKVYLLPASAEGAVFSIEGTVTEKGNATKLEGVVVSYGTAEDNSITDSNGKYGLAKLNQDDYNITFSMAGYKTATKTVSFKGETLVVDVELEKE